MKKGIIEAICDDLLVEILCRLPRNFASLTRFKCVSRSWNALISNDSFVHRYNYLLSRSPPLSGLLSQPITWLTPFLSMATTPVDELFISATPEHDNLLRLRLPAKDPIHDQFSIHASSGGLLLCSFGHMPKITFTYNPVTGEKHTIRQLNRTHNTSDIFGFHVYQYDGLRPRRFIAVQLTLRRTRDGRYLVQVEKFDSDVGRWRVTYHPVQSHLYIPRVAFVRNDIFHWVTMNGKEIAIYDPKEPSFRVITSPLLQPAPSRWTVILGEYGGCLCCCCIDYEGYKGLTMWVLDDDLDSQWLLKSKHSLREMGCEQAGSDTMPYIACFDAEAVYLKWLRKKIDGSYLINFVRYHLGSAMLEFVRQMDGDCEARQYFPFSFMAPAWSPTCGPSM